MRTLIVGGLAALALAAAGMAAAGGWATVGIEPLPPEQADTPWNVTITVLRHGRTPTDGAKPTLTIRNAETGKAITYAAKPAGNGRYTARVTFPSEGTWRYTVNNGLAATGYGVSQTQTFAAVEVVGGGSSDSAAPAWGVVAGAALALAAALLLLARRRRLRPGLATTAQ